MSAPPAVYTISVRMENVGLHARATAGYVQVFRKSTGELEHTYEMSSAVIDPGEEKQAYADATWDLSEEDPGTEFIVSGAITCDGDMVPANDILNPTTVTVIDEPPPPPPPVASHHAQHEDGGTDELNIGGLHGVPADPIPYADHATAHENGGDDEVNIAGLTGTAADPQTPADHGNERHVIDFAQSSELNNHMDDETPHDAATSLEHTANKGQVDGYPELDDTGFVPPGQLADPAGGVDDKFLRGDQSWQDAVMAFDAPNLPLPGYPPQQGVSGLATRADHTHGGTGGIDGTHQLGPFPPPGPNNLIYIPISNGTMYPRDRATIRIIGAILYDSDPGAPPSATFDIYGGNPGSYLVRSTVTISALATSITAGSVSFEALLHMNPSASWSWIKACDHASFPLPGYAMGGPTSTAAISFNNFVYVWLRLQSSGTIVLYDAVSLGDLRFISTT